MPFKVIKVTDVGTNLKPVCDFLLVTKTNRHPISYRFKVIADFLFKFWMKTGHFVCF